MLEYWGISASGHRQLSKTNTATYWGKKWGVSAKEFKAMCERGEIRHKKIGERRWQVDIRDVPTDIRSGY